MEKGKGFPAGFWVRAAAAYLDFVSCLLGLGVAIFLLSALGTRFIGDNAAGFIAGILALLSPLCWVLPVGFSGQTLGMTCLHIKVEGKNGGDATMGQAFGRALAGLLCLLPLGGGFIRVAWDEKKRGWHDLLAGTRVVYAGEPNSVAQTAVLSIAGLSLAGCLLLGLAAAVYLPGLMSTTELAATRNNLDTLKSAVMLYYSDHKGAYPPSLERLTKVEPSAAFPYLDKIPMIKLKSYGHSSSCQVEKYAFTDKKGKLVPSMLKDTGHWLYDPRSGLVVIDCTHKDKRGKYVYNWEID
jgi:uncharacterized RDD family membrane protein YckC